MLRFGFMILPRDPEETRAAARAGEAAGFEWMGIADSPTVYQESYLHQLEAAHVTERIRIGPMTSHVVVRHPVVVANLLATTNEINGGRSIGTIATGNSAARGLGLKPAKLADLGDAFRAIRGTWRGEGGTFKESTIPGTGLIRRGCPLFLGADGPKAAALAGEVADGIVYGGTMDEAVQRRRLDAAIVREGQEAWIAPSVSLAESHDGVRADLGAMVVAMANRAMRGDLDERGVPTEIQDDVRAMWRDYDYGFHADNSRPRNTGVIPDRLSDHLIDTMCMWGSEERWGQKLAGLESAGWTGVMFILGQAEQLSVVEAVGARLRRLGLMG
ncbi:MAG: class flavin-dependent oxidoreductase [Conexibacter sp.]|nr:class flavin-dependent oxidoreductase [Conexibacter sp.]